MNMIKVYEQVLKELLELLLGKNDCFAIAKALGEKMTCYEDGCAEECCPFFNAENLIKDLSDEWEDY